MRKSKFSESRIFGVLKDAESGAPATAASLRMGPRGMKRASFRENVRVSSLPSGVR